MTAEPSRVAVVKPPIFGSLAALCAVMSVFSPRFLLFLPVLLTLGLGAGAFFARERWKWIAVVAMVWALGLLVLNERGGSPGTNLEALADITNGATTAGALTSPTPQFVCYDEVDALKGAPSPEPEAVPGTAGAVAMQLVRAGRCTYTDEKARFDMTADGKERFTTPHGAIELWAARSP
jgi:hypothetical protein